MHGRRPIRVGPRSTAPATASATTASPRTATSRPENRPQIEWRAGVWLFPYLIGMVVISYLSSFDTAEKSKVVLLGLKGPVNDLHFDWDVLVTVVFSLVIYAVAIHQRLSPEQVRENVGDLTEEAEEIEAELAETPL